MRLTGAKAPLGEFLESCPAGWDVATFGEIAETQLGKMLSQKTRPADNPKPYLRNQNVQWGRFDLRDVWSLEIRPDEAKRFQLVAGDLLVCEGGEVGRAAIWNGEIGECYYQKALHRVRPGPRTIAGYLYWILALYKARDLFQGFSTGTTISHLSQEALRELPLPLPPLGEQLRLVEVVDRQLSRVDAALVDLDSASRKLATYEYALLHAATLGRVASNKRLPSELTASSTSDTSLPELPAGWKWAKLESIADVVGGVPKDTKKQSGTNLVDVPYLRVANVQRGRLDLRDVSRIRVPIAVANKLALLKGDVLMNEGGDRDKLGRGWVWDGQIPDCIHQNHVFRVRVRAGALDPRFLSWHGNTFGQAWFQREGKQSTDLASISLNRLRQLPVPVPPLDEQRAIVGDLERRLSVIAAIRIEMEQVRSKARKLRFAILSAAFTGRLSAGLELSQAGPMREALAGVVK